MIKDALGSKLQVTLAIIKPHVIQAPHALKGIRERICKSGFFVLKTDRIHLQKERAENFYSEHKGKFFFSRLVTFMCSGHCDIHILARENAIQHWRDVLGPTKVYHTVFTHSESIRGRFGLSDTRNAAHGSDSEASAEKEINFFFPQVNLCNLLKSSQKALESGPIKFDEDKFEHRF